jgi:hypothetical protein
MKKCERSSLDQAGKIMVRQYQDHIDLYSPYQKNEIIMPRNGDVRHAHGTI